MSDNSFQAFYEELKMLVEKFEKKTNANQDGI